MTGIKRRAEIKALNEGNRRIFASGSILGLVFFMDKNLSRRRAHHKPGGLAPVVRRTWFDRNLRFGKKSCRATHWFGKELYCSHF